MVFFFIIFFIYKKIGGTYGLDVSTVCSLVVGGCNEVVIARNTATGAVLWQKKLPVHVLTLRIHGGMVVVPVAQSNTVVLDIFTGHLLHTLPSAGNGVFGICMFDGLTSVVISFCSFSHAKFLLQRR